MSRKIPGEFVPLDVHYLQDKEIRRAGVEAEHLYLRGLAWAKAAHSDGVILAWDLDAVGVGLPRLQARMKALVREHLWEELPDGGWHITGWTKWNMLEAEKSEERDKKRAAAVKTNHKRYHQSDPDPECPHCQANHATTP